MLQGREQIPTCFGREWDQKALECIGGPDATFTDPLNGSHVRERCQFFSACGARTQANKNDQNRLVPLRSSATAPYPPTPQPPPQPAPGPSVQQLQQQVTQLMQLVQKQQQLGPGYPQQYPMQNIQPVNFMATEMSIPRYLTVPEPRKKGKSVWGMLVREVGRSMLKSAGHTAAHFWDTTPFEDGEE